MILEKMKERLPHIDFDQSPVSEIGQVILALIQIIEEILDAKRP